MRWPFSPGAWFAAGTGAVAVMLVGYACVSMRSGERPASLQHRGAQGPGWQWSSSPTSAGNTASGASIGFRITVVESVERTSPLPPPSRVDGGIRQIVAQVPSAVEPDAFAQHLSAVGNVDFDELDELDRSDRAAPVQPSPIPADSVPTPLAAVKHAPAPLAAARAKPPVRSERAGAPPVQRRARREALAAAAPPATRPNESPASGDGLDELAQRLLQGVGSPQRRTAPSGPVDAGVSVAPGIVRDAPGPFACPEAARD